MAFVQPVLLSCYSFHQPWNSSLENDRPQHNTQAASPAQAKVSRPLPGMLGRALWLGLGWTCVGLGVVGAFLPLLPTTPFLLLAAFSFSRGSNKLHSWLINHPKLGPPITDWQQHRAISRRVKWVATLSMVAVFGLSLLMQVPSWALLTQAGVLLCVAGFLWTRAERPEESRQKP